MLSRRFFMKSGALALASLSLTGKTPSFLERMVSASTVSSKPKTIVVIFQRGAADGLNIIVPFAEPNYYKLRPSLAIRSPKSGDSQAAIDLDGFFGLHPAMVSFKELFQQQKLAIVHAVGSPDSTRSHFDAQDYMELGTPGIKSTSDGWLNRYLQKKYLKQPLPLRAVAIGRKEPKIFTGKAPTVTVGNLSNFGTRSSFEAMYADTQDQILANTGTDTFEAIKTIKQIKASSYTPANGAEYSKGSLGQSLKQIAQLIKANVGLEVAFTDMDGWDTHVNQPQRLQILLTEFSNSISAFIKDLGDRAEDVVVVTMSEFGRTAAENGTRGTDHGHATCMFVVGGNTKGGKIYGEWPGLEKNNLYEGRDLALTTDYRSVCLELVEKHCGLKETTSLFPSFKHKPLSIL
ncbi:MAG: DUF1501 domain-containing protein [Blastocatellia bacterium]|nr:DUF1501 domain-containing protein [Blastocatellia bacterium]